MMASSTSSGNKKIFWSFSDMHMELQLGLCKPFSKLLYLLILHYNLGVAYSQPAACNLSFFSLQTINEHDEIEFFIFQYFFRPIVIKLR